MKLVDLHCDTALALYHRRESLQSAPFHVSLEKAAYLDKYIQLAAFFTPPKLSDEEGWAHFLAVRDYFLRECDKNSVPVIENRRDLAAFDRSDAKTAFILTVEDGRILSGQRERVKALYDMGIRVVTPLWGGHTSMGGSHDTPFGLSDFGKEAVGEMLSLGIVPDISHASFASADDILDRCEAAKQAPIATHMNAYDLCAHSRNLTEDRLTRLVKLGGVVGVSFCPPHLTEETPCTADHVTKHFLYYQKHAPGHLCFGSDFDGTDLPANVADLTAVPMLYQKMREQGLSEKDLGSITWNTPYAYLEKNLPA